MKFKQIAILETIAYILGSGVVGIYLAYSGYGVWSLVGALLASSMITAALALIALRRKYRIHFSFVEHKHLLHFGSRFSFNSFLEYIGSSLDTFITGRVFSANMLGFYNRAFMLANLPTQFLITSITRVMYPTFAKLQSNKQHLAEAEQMLLAVVGSLSMAVCLGMLPAAKDIVLVLLGQKWMESVRVLEILLLAVPLNFMSHVLALTFDAVGELKRKTRIQIVSISFLAISLVFLLPLGLSGIASAVVVSTAIKLGLYITQTKKVMAVPIIKQMKVVLEAVVAGLVVFAGIRIVSAAVANASIAPIVALFFEIVTGGFAITLFFLMNIPKLLGFEQTAEIGAYVRKYVRERLGGQNA
jgi:lipopolysaccharide exporter